MKKLLFIFASLFLGLICKAQESYFTVYNVTVENQNVSTIYKLFDDYFSENKAAGITVSLYENHFNDSDNNYTHSVVFSGSLDAMGDMYSGGNNDSWNLFLTRVNQQTKASFSSAMGQRLAAYGNADEEHPYQRYFMLHVDEMSKWIESYKRMMDNNNPEGRLSMMGNISAGQGPDGANAWVINGFKDFKTAMGGVTSLRTDAENEAAAQAWEKHRDEGGEVELVRTGLRILLKSW
jgi:hypothetical protein